MVKYRSAALLTCLVLLAGASTVFGQKATRIRFARGATRATVTGTLKGYRDEKVFVIRVRSGQTLGTEQVGDDNHITIYIKGPNGEDVGDSDASCNNRRLIEPTAAGDYRITVVECRKADPWRGRFRFRVTVR
jgi:hypothetical protein